MPQDALELQFRELRDQILNADRKIEELKKQLNRIAMEKEDLLKEKNNLQEQVDYLKKKLFGTSSEKRSGELEGQLRFLINEAEVLCDIVESLPAEEEPEEALICDTSETNPSKPRQKRKTLEEALEGKTFTKRYVDLPEDKKVYAERRTKGLVKSICVQNMTSFLPESGSSSGTASLTNAQSAPATELFRN